MSKVDNMADDPKDETPANVVSFADMLRKLRPRSFQDRVTNKPPDMNGVA
jgi:hypothetical protein